MSLQALGADNETIIYLSADGDGTEVIPFKSIFLAEQYEDWSVTILNPSIAVTGTFFPAIQAVSQSGEWTINLSTETLLALGTVDTNIDQPLTVIQLDATTVKVEEQNPIDLSVISNKIPTGLEVDINNRLKVDTELDQPLTLSQLQGITVNVSEQNPIEIAAIDSIDSKIPTGLEVVTGRLKVDANVALPTVYNIEATALPLPIGAATSSNQTEIISTLDSLDTKLPTLTLTGDALKVDAAVALPLTYPVEVNNYSSLVTALESAILQAEVTNNVSIVGSVDINTAGLATDANISITNDYLEVINNKLPTLVQPLTDVQLRASAVPVSISNIPAVSQSGTWNINLPSGASTAANQTLILNAVTALDTKLTNDTIKVNGSAHTQPISGTVAVSNHPNTLTDTQLRAAPINVTVQDLANILASTTLQAEINNNVSVVGSLDFDGISTEGQQLAIINLLVELKTAIEGGVDAQVVNYADLISALQTITIQSEVINTVPVITDNNIDIEPIVLEQQASNTLLESIEAKLGTGSSDSLTDTQLRAAPLNVEGDFYQAVQPISGSVTANIGTVGVLATAANQTTANSSLSSIDSKTPALGQALASASVPVVLTEAQVTALTPPSSVGITGTPTVNIGTMPPVAVTGTFWQATQPVSLTTLPSLASGSNTIGAISNTEFDVLQSGTWDVSVNNFPATVEVTNDAGSPLAINGTVTANTGLSQPLTDEQLRASAVPVSGTFYQATQPVSLISLPALATGSNIIGSIANTSFDATQSGTWNINNVSGVISLPTGAATSANQATEITSLQLLDDVIATHDSAALTKHTQIGGVDPFGLAQPFATTTEGELQIVQANGATDMFGTQRVGSQFNQIDIQFYRSAIVSNLVNVVAPTGTGYSQIVDGGLVIGTGAGANGFQRVNSYNTTTYRSGSEEYCYFTLITTATTNANSYQRIIFGDATNGFGIGLNGINFGIFSRYNTIDTHVTQANFNLDTLNGSVNSRFTRVGIPEALDPTKANVYRIRFGWVGGAPDLFEVLSPDGRWVAFHILRHPNTFTRASISNADLPITAEVSKTAGDAVDLKITTFCWGAGITGDPMVKGLTPVSVQVTNAVQTIKAGGGLLYGWQIYNPGNNTAYIHLYDTGAAITIGTTPAKFFLGNGSADNIPILLPAPVVFNNSIKIAASTAFNNASAPNQPQNVTLFYQ